jgi:hypothetical protein
MLNKLRKALISIIEDWLIEQLYVHYISEGIGVTWLLNNQKIVKGKVLK